MRKVNIPVFLSLLAVFVFCCSKEDTAIVHSGISAKVIRSVSCTKDVYEIEAELPDSNQIIGVVDLPDIFKKENLTISLDLLEFDESNLACVTLSPNKYYFTSVM